MSAGRFCEKHEEWCPNGECRWCEPADMAQSRGMLVPSDIANGMRGHWRNGVTRLNGAPVAFDGRVMAPAASPKWPAPLSHTPPAFRFVDAATGKPKPLVGKHFRAADRDACALCGMSGPEILANPQSECEPLTARQSPPEPLKFDDWTPGEPVTLDGRPLNSAFWDGGQQPLRARAVDIEDAMNRMWVKPVEREQPPRLPFDEWLGFYGMKDSE